MVNVFVQMYQLSRLFVTHSVNFVQFDTASESTETAYSSFKVKKV